jgi:hypothetical protein
MNRGIAPGGHADWSIGITLPVNPIIKENEPVLKDKDLYQD